MRLSQKLTLYLITGIIALLSCWGYLAVQREVRLFEIDMVRDHELLASALASAAERVGTVEGRQHAIELLDRINAGQSLVHLRYVPPDAVDRELHLDAQARSQLLDDGQPTHGKLESAEPTLYTYTRLRLDREGPGALELRESLAPRDAYVRSTVLRTTATALSLALLCSLLVATLGTRLVGRPVRALVEQARRIGAGDLSARLELSQQDEIGELASEMNAMSVKLAEANRKLLDETAARIDALEQLRHADRLATVGKLASGVAHELGTPLSVVSGRAKMILRAPTVSPDIQHNARIVTEQSERMARIIRQLLDFARAGESHKTELDIRSLASQTLVLLEPMARKANVELELSSALPIPRLVADPSQIQQVLTNLIMNAVQASNPSGTVSVRIGLEGPGQNATQSQAYLCLEVLDHGQGMSEETLSRIFEPFFTTKDVGEGTGLGLSVAYGIVREHGGLIEVESAPDRGSRFRVYLPVKPEREQAA